MNRVLEELPHSQFFIFNPNSKVYGYKFEYGPQNQPGSNKVIIKKFAQNEGLTKIFDIAPIQTHLENMCATNVPTVYQNENCLFLYQFTKTFFENLVLRAQDQPAAKNLQEEMMSCINKFRQDCISEAEIKIKDYFENIVMVGIHQYFKEVKDNKIGKKEVT